LKAQDIARVDLKVHSLVLELTGKKTPQDGLQAKFSVYHSCAAGLIQGRAGEDEYHDHFVQSHEVITLRDKVNAVVDPAINEDQVFVAITLNDGRVLNHFVEHAIGSMTNPLTDAMLDQKFTDLVTPVLGAARAAQLIQASRTLGQAPNVKQLCSLAQA